MTYWRCEPLWRLFEAAGVNPATMTPGPLYGPTPVALPEPASVADEPSQAEIKMQVWRISRKLAKIDRQRRPWLARR
jgi:hypothetical protein